MLTGKDFWSLIEHIIPVYAILLLGYSLVRFEIVLPVHLPGVSRWNMIGIPAYVFNLLAFNDPYSVTLKLVGADALQKVVALVVGCLWWKFAKSGNIEDAIGFFMLTTLPNTVLIGDDLLEPLYGDGIATDVVTIIFLQSLLWYNVCIILCELRIVLMDMQPKESLQLQAKEQAEEGDILCKSPTSFVGLENTGPGGSPNPRDVHFNGFRLSPISSDSPAIQGTLSDPARVSFSKTAPVMCEPSFPRVNESSKQEGETPEAVLNHRSKGDHGQGFFVADNDVHAVRQVTRLSKESRNGHEQDIENAVQCARADIQKSMEPQKPDSKSGRNPLAFGGIVLCRVLIRLKYSGITYASVLGFAYGLLAYKYNWTMPYYVNTSVNLISQGAVGCAIFLVGTTWATSGRVISCGLKRMTYGMVLRFLVGPFIMIATSLLVGLRGDKFRFAVLQAAIPQGVISFVFAKEYGLNEKEFSTAVVFQLTIFMPFIIAYYLILDSV